MDALEDSSRRRAPRGPKGGGYAMFCTSCGKELAEGTKFCTRCGKPVVQVTPREEPGQRPEGEGAPANGPAPAEVAVPVEGVASAEEVAPAAEAMPVGAPAPEAESAQAAASVPIEEVAPADEPAPAQGPAPKTAPLVDDAVGGAAADDQAAADAADAKAAEDALWPADAEGASGAEPTRVIPQPPVDAAPQGAPAQQGAAPQPGFAPDGAIPPGQTAWQPPVAPQDPGAQNGQVPPEQPRKKKPVALIAGIACVVLAAIIAVCIFVVPRLMGEDVVYFGQRDALACSVVTRIRPRDAEGNDLTSYAVRLVERTADNLDADGAPTLEQVVAEIRVTGTSGFTFEDFGDIPDGDYVLVIVDEDTGEEYRNDIEYVHDQTTVNETYVIQPEPEPDTSAEDAPEQEEPEVEEPSEDELAYAAYYRTCQELIGEHGEPGTVELYDGQETMVTGLALAELIDFDGDGTDELLTIVCNLEAQDGSIVEYSNEGYVAQVWDYRDGEVVQLYDRASEFSNGGSFYQYLYERDGLPVLGTSWYADTTGTSIEEYHSGYFMLGADGFETIAQLNSFFDYDTGDLTESFAIDGVEATDEQWATFVDETPATQCYTLLQFSSVSGTERADSTMEEVDPEACVSTTDETLAELEEGAGEALEETGETEAEADGAADSEQAVRDAVAERLDAFKNGDAAAIDEVAGIIDGGWAQLMDGPTFTACGGDPDEYARMMLDGFDYTIGGIAIDPASGTATVEVFANVRDVFQVIDGFEAMVDEYRASDEYATSTLEEDNQRYAEMLIEAAGNAGYSSRYAFTLTLTEADGAWTLDEDTWGTEIDWLFNIVE